MAGAIVTGTLVANVMVAVAGAAAGMAGAVALATVALGRWKRRVAGRLAGLVGPLATADERGLIDADHGIEALLDAAGHVVAAEAFRRHAQGVEIERLADALSALPQGVVVCDEHGVVRYRNEAGWVFSGARHGEALAELAVTELLARALQGEPAEQHLELYGPPRRALLISARPLGEPPVGAVAIIDDVSERRRLDAVRRDFVANVSHELKTPIGALSILAETIQAEDDPAVLRRLAVRIQVEAFRVARIIDDLLDLSRIESEEAPVREPVAVDTLVEEAVDRIRPLAEHRGIAVARQGESGPMSVVGDRRQLVSALHNLLDNAVKYSDTGSSVQVRARAVTDQAGEAWVEISVHDHGIGIPSRDLERIFERFYRVDRARARDTGGTGLGLAIAGHIATNHRGEVRVASREGEGSTFTLRLPSAPGSPAAAVPPMIENG